MNTCNVRDPSSCEYPKGICSILKDYTELNSKSSKNAIQGNFIKYAIDENKASIDALKLDISKYTDFVDTDTKSIRELENGVCLEYTHISSGSSKTGFILKPINEKHYVVLNQNISYKKDNYDTFNYFTEIYTQLKIFSVYEDLVPKIIALNAYEHKDEHDKILIIQKIEENAITDGFSFIKENFLNVGIPEHLHEIIDKTKDTYKKYKDYKDSKNSKDSKDSKNHTYIGMFGIFNASEYHEQEYHEPDHIEINLDKSNKLPDIFKHNLDSWWSLPNVSFFMTGLFESLFKLHIEGVFHCDIREGNLLYKLEDGKYKFRFIDFGSSYNIPIYQLYYMSAYNSNSFFQPNNSVNKEFYTEYFKYYHSVHKYFEKYEENILDTFKHLTDEKDVKELFYNLMMLELCPFKTNYFFSLLNNTIFGNYIDYKLYYLYIGVLKSPDESPKSVYLSKYVINVYKDFIATKYSEHIYNTFCNDV